MRNTSILAATFALATLGLAACTAPQQATLLTNETQVLASANTALADYAIAKGIAQVAEAAEPSLNVVLVPALALTDSYAAKLQAAVTAISIDTVAVNTLVAQISAQVQQITATAAPAVKVVPSSVATVASGH